MKPLWGWEKEDLNWVCVRTAPPDFSPGALGVKSTSWTFILDLAKSYQPSLKDICLSFHTRVLSFYIENIPTESRKATSNVMLLVWMVLTSLLERQCSWQEQGGKDTLETKLL